jgi:hypothetical protein
MYISSYVGEGRNVRNPDLKGACGRVWKLPLWVRSPEQEATLAVWLVHAPGSHPWWPWKEVCLIHLRDLPEVKPAHKKYPEAEYELLILSIDPIECPNPDPDLSKDGYPLLDPPDVVEQFDVKGSDHDAKRIGDAAMTAIVNGFISPDQDWRSVWSAMIKDTADHFKAGAHVEN